MEVTEGTVVRDRRWGGRFVGTVVRREGNAVFVSWHKSGVEDELGLDEVEVVEHPSPEQQAWRGGIGVVGSDGEFAVVPLGRS